MYGETVTLDLGNSIQVKVFVMGTPDLTEDEWQRRAWATLRAKLDRLEKGEST